MDHRKIVLDPEDLKKLEALLKAEENAVDQMSDAELEAAEKALEQRIRNLAKNSPIATADADKNWEKIQTKMDAAVPVSNVISLEAKRKSFAWPALGMLAVAALALIVITPKLRQNQQNPSDLSQLQTKGLEGSGEMTNFCDVEIRGRNGETIPAAGNGQDFIISPKEGFQISFKCDADGFLQVWSNGPSAIEFRNIPVEREKRTGRELRIVLGPNAAESVGLALTKEQIPEDVDLLHTPIPAQRFDSITPAWADSISVKGRGE